MNYLIKFAQTGNPNGLGRPTWTPFDLKNNQYMEFSEVVAMTDICRLEKYKLLEDFYDRQRMNQPIY